MYGTPTQKAHTTMKNTLRILGLLLGLTLIGTACQGDTSETGITALWFCSGEHNTYTVMISNPTSEMQEVHTSEDDYIVTLVPGKTEIQTHELPWNGLPHVYVSLPDGTEDLHPDEHMICLDSNK